jgi:signal transduction histidine kinase
VFSTQPQPKLNLSASWGESTDTRDATQEMRLKTVELLRIVVGTKGCFFWEFHPNHTLRLYGFNFPSSPPEQLLIFCQNIIESKQSLLSQGMLLGCNQQDHSQSFVLNETMTKPSSHLFLPCLYQQQYLGGIYLHSSDDNDFGEERDIKLLRKLVEQYACSQHWIHHFLANEYPLQSRGDLLEMITQTLNVNLDIPAIVVKILGLIGKYFEVDYTALLDQEKPDQVLGEWYNESGCAINSMLNLPIVVREELVANLVLKTSHSNRNFTPQEIQLLEQICGRLALLYQTLKCHRKLQELTLHQETIEAFHQSNSETLSHIHHELRTPLTGILGFSRMLREELYGPLNEKQKQYIQGIVNSGEHLLSLVNDFLDLSKLDAHREELFLEMVAVEDICLSSLSIVQSKAREQGIDLNLEIAQDVDVCMTDQKRLKQILLNLLSNAIKFTERGSVTLKVERYSNKLTFSVIDTGIGIKPEDQLLLFQPFKQIYNSLSRKQKGTGLGLAVSKKLAQLHGGDITLVSEEGKGSCFILHLPI